MLRYKTKMNSKEFTELKKSLEAKVNESIRGFNTTEHSSGVDNAIAFARVAYYVAGVNEVLRTIADKTDLEYKDIEWPSYKHSPPDYSEVRI